MSGLDPNTVLSAGAVLGSAIASVFARRTHQEVKPNGQSLSDYWKYQRIRNHDIINNQMVLIVLMLELGRFLGADLPESREIKKVLERLEAEDGRDADQKRMDRGE